MRILYVENHAIFADQNYQWNNAPSDYVWQRATGTTAPTGPLASVATRQVSVESGILQRVWPLARLRGPPPDAKTPRHKNPCNVASWRRAAYGLRLRALALRLAY